MSTYLHIYQIGPVQSFIAAARRTQDLYVGSRMLSELASAGIQQARKDPSFKPIFPMIVNDRLPRGVPHRFAFLADSDPQTLAIAVERAIRQAWVDQFVNPVGNWLVNIVGEGEWADVYERQTANWLEFQRVAVPYNQNRHSACYQEASRLLATRRAMRTFEQVEESGYKCTLTGAQSQLSLGDKGWERLRQRVGEIALRKGEQLGAIAMIKRFAGQGFAKCAGISDQDFPSTDQIAGIDQRDAGEQRGKEVSGYLAVLHMDGDRMGKRISECKSLQDHQEFSMKLAQFADREVPAIINQYDRRDGKRHAKLVYAGGDDVLALLPLKLALACANDLRQSFQKLTGCSASAGIAVTPYNLPLDNALNMARQAEKVAKEGYDRDAVVIVEAHGTGQQRASGSRWEPEKQSIVQLVDDLQSMIEQASISGKIGYEIAELARQLVPDLSDQSLKPDKRAELAALNEVLKDARKADLKRLITRRLGEKVSDKKAIVEDLQGRFFALGESKQCGWDSLANWIIFSRFLASEGKRS